MTKKHFKALAAAIAFVRREAKIRPGISIDGARLMDLITDEIASVCASFNRRFDRDRFIRASVAKSPLEEPYDMSERQADEFRRERGRARRGRG